MRIAVVEDEAPQRAQLCGLVKAAAAERGFSAVLFEYGEADALLRAGAADLDLILMDIDMPGMSGMEAAHVIRETDSQVMIAFCTGLVSRALDGYAVQALDFLVKPVSGARIGELLEKAERQLGLRRPRMLTLRMQEETVILPVQEPRFAETYGRKLRLHAGERSIDLRMTMAALEKQLPPGAFFRVHNAYLVSLAHVRGITGLTLDVGGEEVPVSRHKKREFMQALTAYLGEQL